MEKIFLTTSIFVPPQNMYRGWNSHNDDTVINQCVLLEMLSYEKEDVCDSH